MLQVCDRIHQNSRSWKRLWPLRSQPDWNDTALGITEISAEWQQTAKKETWGYFLAFFLAFLGAAFLATVFVFALALAGAAFFLVFLSPNADAQPSE